VIKDLPGIQLNDRDSPSDLHELDNNTQWYNAKKRNQKTATCPPPLAVFRLEDYVLGNLPAEIPLKTYNIKIEETAIYVQIE
jgi:hypothetical protein